MLSKSNSQNLVKLQTLKPTKTLQIINSVQSILQILAYLHVIHLSFSKSSFNVHMKDQKLKTFITALFYLILSSLLIACNEDSSSDPTHTHTDEEEKITLILGNSITLDVSEKSIVNGDKTTFEWGITRTPEGSSLTAFDNPSSVVPTFTPDIEGTYQLSLVVIDGAEKSETLFTITVNKDLSQASPGAGSSGLIGSEIALSGTGVFNNDATFKWQIKSLPENSSIGIDAISDINIVNPVFTPDVAGEYIFTLIVTNDTGISMLSEIKITALENNTPPVANAGEDNSVDTLSTVTLTAAGSYDQDGDPLSYSWTLIQSPASNTVNLQETSSQTLTFTPDAEGDYEFLLTVSDGIDTGTATVLITASSSVGTVNIPPVAKAGPNQETLVNQQVLLDGSESTDAEGEPLSYLWTITSRPENSAASLDSNTAPNPSFMPDMAGAYTLSLVVNDGKTDSTNAAVTIINVLSPNTAPVANAGLNQFVLINNTVNLNGNSSYDPDGSEITYSWQITTSPTGNSANLIDNLSATPQFTPDIAGEYLVTLEVSDGEKSSQASILITAEDTTEGTKSQPKVLSYLAPSRFPYAGNIQNSSSFYQVTELDSNTDYHIYLTELNDNVDLIVYDDNAFSNIICESHNSFIRHENCIGKAIATNGTLYIQVDSSLAANNAQYTLNITPAVDEGTEETPIVISLDTPYLGTTRTDTSYYLVEGVDATKNYVISLKNKTGASLLWGGYDTNPEECHLTTNPDKNYLCNIQNHTSNSLRIKILHNTGETSVGKSFELFVTEGQAINSEGTEISPIPLTYNDAPLEYTAGQVDTNTSYYQLTGLTIGADYDIWLPDLNDNIYLEVIDDSGTTISGNNFPKQFSFNATTSNINIRVHGDESKIGLTYTLSIQENTLQLVSEGTINDPVLLPYDIMLDSLTHAGSVDSTTNSYYKITDLPIDKELVFAITELSDDADLFIYSNPEYSNLICESQQFIINDDICAYAPTNDVLYIRVNGSKTLKGADFNLTVAPPLFNHEGSIDVPVELDASLILNTGYDGGVDTEYSYYKINNLLQNTSYEIRLEQPSGDVDLYVYTSSFSSATVCLSENWADDFVENCIATTTDTSLLIKVSGTWSGSGAGFVIKATQQ